jgi:hypothetical protein
LFSTGNVKVVLMLPENAIKTKGSRKNIIFAFISFACPVTAYLLVTAYQTSQNAEFWGKANDPEYHFVYATMAVGELVEAASWTLVGCLIGLFFAGVSLWLKPKVLSIGAVALALNLLPILLIVFTILWSRDGF